MSAIVGGMADAAGTLYIADGTSNRVLEWKGFPTTDGQPADVALGQGPDEVGHAVALEGFGPVRQVLQRLKEYKLYTKSSKY